MKKRMKQRMKQLTSLAAAAVMVTGLLSGCGNQTTEEETTKAINTADSVSTENKSDEGAEAYTELPSDYKGTLTMWGGMIIIIKQ